MALPKDHKTIEDFTRYIDKRIKRVEKMMVVPAPSSSITIGMAHQAGPSELPYELEKILEDEKLYERFASAFEEIPHTEHEMCILDGPRKVAVRTASGEYRTKALIGGESFKPAFIYKGTKGAVIARFVPLEASPFAHMEMPIALALTAFGGPFLRAVQHAIRVMDVSFQEKFDENKVDTYKGDYGSW